MLPIISHLDYDKGDYGAGESFHGSGVCESLTSSIPNGPDVTDIPERAAFMKESVCSAEKALQLNSENVKAKYRIPAARFEYALTLEESHKAVEVLTKTA